jgi:hypothetical protein
MATGEETNPTTEAIHNRIGGVVITTRAINLNLTLKTLMKSKGGSN